MSALETLYQRNEDFATDFPFADLELMPTLKTIVLTCFDARVDPGYFLGLEPGEALAIRNSGGRVTDQVIEDVAMVYAMAAVTTDDRPRGISLVIVQHTQCGLERLANPEVRAGLGLKSGVSDSALRALAISDHVTAIEEDLSRLQDSLLIPPELVVSAHVYDVKTGQLEQIVAPRPAGFTESLVV